MSKVLQKIKKEFIEILPPTIFFFISLSLVTIVHRLMLRGTDVPVGTWVQVVIGALILGKAVLISDLLPIINRFPDKPLAYNIAWKTAIYSLAALLIRYIELLIDFWKQAGSFAAANEKLWAQIIWTHFWAIQIVLLMIIFQYCVLHELQRVLGWPELREMFFGQRAAAPA
jgi:hypothetical protein